MIKRFIAPVIALLVVVTGLTFIGTNYNALAKPSETDQAYFMKHLPEVSMVLVEPNYGTFFNPDPCVQGDPSGEALYSSLDELAHSYDIKHTEMIRFERKGEMIPNLYVFVDSPSEEFQVADSVPSNFNLVAENIEL